MSRVCDVHGRVFTIEQKHIDYGLSYQYPEPHKTGFEAFLWDTFGEDYDDIRVEADKIEFIDEAGHIRNSLEIGEKLTFWIEKDALHHEVFPADVVIGDVPEFYKIIELVDELGDIFPGYEVKDE